jgi:hypothetical protein
VDRKICIDDDACWWKDFSLLSLCCYLICFASIMMCVGTPTLVLLLPSDHVCLVLLVHWNFFYVCQQFVVVVVVAQGIQSFEIREIGDVVCSWQQSLTQSGESHGCTKNMKN